MTVDLWMPYMLMLVLITLTLMQGHSGSAMQQIRVAACSRQLNKQAGINKHMTCCNGKPFFCFTWPWLCKRLYGLTNLFYHAFETYSSVLFDNGIPPAEEDYAFCLEITPHWYFWYCRNCDILAATAVKTDNLIETKWRQYNQELKQELQLKFNSRTFGQSVLSDKKRTWADAVADGK